MVLLCAVGRNPTAIAAALFRSRSSVYRAVRAYRTGTLGLEHDTHGRRMPPVRTTMLLPTLRRALRALLKTPPRASGWCRTRWSCAALALTLQRQRGLTVSAETLRRWLHEVGWVWKRAKLAAKDDDPQRVTHLARLRWVFEQLQFCEALVFADALDRPLLPKVGCAWMPTGTPREVMTPGQNQKHDRAGALDLTTGTLHHCRGPQKTNALVRDRLSRLEERSPADRYRQLSVVVDHDKIHTAQAVEQWLATPPRVTRLFLPPSCPQAKPIARAFGDGHDCCPRNHQRQRLPTLMADVEDHVLLNGPWLYKLPDLYDEPAVTAAVEKNAAEEPTTVAA
jgi:transposase